MTTATAKALRPLTIQEAKDFPTPRSVAGRDNQVTARDKARDIATTLGDKLSDTQLFDYKQAAQILSAHFDAEFKPNTLNARWFPKVWKALKDLPAPGYRIQDGITGAGNPKWKPLGWSIRLLAHWYQWTKVEGIPQDQWEAYIRDAFPATTSTPVEVEVVEDFPATSSSSAMATYQESSLAMGEDADDDRAGAMAPLDDFYSQQQQTLFARRRRLAEVGRKMARQDFKAIAAAYTQEMEALQGEEAAIALENE